MKTLRNILIILIVGIILGFINEFLIDRMFWSFFVQSLGASFWLLNILYCLIALFLVILVHELGHLMSFVFQNIRIKGIYVLCFVVIKINGKWKFKIFPKFLSLMGGLVIPDLPPIKNDEDYDRIIDVLKKALIAGPDTSIIYCGVISFLYIISLLIGNPIFAGIMFYVFVTTLLLTLIVVKASKVSYQGLFGDYIAERELGKNERFTLAYLLSAYEYATEEEQSKPYLWKMLIHELGKGLKVRNTFSLHLLIIYLHTVVFEGEIGCWDIFNQVKNLAPTVSREEAGFILYQYIIYLTYITEGLDKALTLLEKQKDMKFKVSENVRFYWEVFTNHALKLVDGSKYLNDPKFIHSSQNAWIYEPFEIENELPVIK
jgi:hypothetical protein